MNTATNWMASALNKQCQNFISEYPQPGASELDIFVQKAHKVSQGVCNPPWHMIPKALSYLAQSKHYEVLLVVPYHLMKLWWHTFQTMAKMTITIYRVIFHLTDGAAVKAHQSMICGCLCKNISGFEEQPRKKCIRF